MDFAVRSPVDLGLQQRYHGVHLNDVLPQSTPYPLCERRGGRPGLPVPNSPYGLCGRKATLTKKREDVLFLAFMLLNVHGGEMAY